MAIRSMKIRSLVLLTALMLLSSCGSRRAGMVQQPRPQEVPDAIVSLTTINPQPVQPVQETVVMDVAQEQVAVNDTWEGRIVHALDSMCHGPLARTSQIGLCVYDLTEGRMIYAHNEAQRLRPASCQKLITAISALHYLSGDYQFRTALYTTGNISGRVLKGDVYVVGGMDPLLSAEELLALAKTLKQKGIDQITGSLYTDLSMKDDLPLGWGWCWDDEYGPLSALMVGAKDEFSTLWPKVLNTAGIRLKSNQIGIKTLPANGAQLVGTVNHTFDEVLVPMLKKSENIYAECVFYQLAAMGGVKNAGRKEAQEHILQLMEQWGVGHMQCQIGDGSGLSLYNYLTPLVLVTFLNYAYQTPAIGNHLIPALPIAGIDGTLEKRMKGTLAEGNVCAKTGSVDGVSTLSGYLRSTHGHQLSFSIMNEGIARYSFGRDFQDVICQILCSMN